MYIVNSTTRPLTTMADISVSSLGTSSIEMRAKKWTLVQIYRYDGKREKQKNSEEMKTTEQEIKLEQ